MFKNKVSLNKIYKSQSSHNFIIKTPFGWKYSVYCDYIASGQSLSFIENFISKSVLPTYANTHTEASYSGRITSSYREEARSIIKRCVNANEKDFLVFVGSGSTGAIDLVVRNLKNRYKDKATKPLIIIGPYEHHSNILPWREADFDLVELPLGGNGNIDINILEDLLKENQGERDVIGCFSAASNVTGIIAPFYRIHSMLKKYGALSFWDFAGAAPYINIDMNPKYVDGVDAIFISTHKFIGGPGTPGVLVAKRSLFQGEKPVVPGGGTVDYVTKRCHKYSKDIEAREEGGTPDIVGSIRAGLVFALKDSIGAERIKNVEISHINQAIKKLSKLRNVEILGNLNESRLGFLSFQIRSGNKYLHYNYVTALLNDLFGIQVRGGCSCAGPYGHDLLNIDNDTSETYIKALNGGNMGIKPGWIRLNINYFIPKKEIDYILEAIKWVSFHGWKLLNMYSFNKNNGLWKINNYSQNKYGLLQSFNRGVMVQQKGLTIFKYLSWKTNFIQANYLARECQAQIKDQKSNPESSKDPLQWFPVPVNVM